MRLSKIAMLAATMLPLASYAALGGAPNTGTPSPIVLRAGQQSAPPSTAAGTVSAAPYTTHRSVDANGVTIREYVLPGNVVFAVTWDGPVRPDMSALLGSYFPNFTNAAAERARGVGPMIEHNGEFHIESAGRAGRFFGKAYLPRLVPANVRVEQLQ